MTKSPTKVAISGTSSESGKTTLMCQLLRQLPEWEAIKMTRGHYRSCGKDPHACCVSNLLGDEPLIKSGFLQTYADDKDTGRYWQAGAANVHWVIVTDDQVERGIELALARVEAPGVLIEGNSFLKFVDVDFSVLVVNIDEQARIKGSTRWAFEKASALYTSETTVDTSPALFHLTSKYSSDSEKNEVPVYAASEFSKLLARVQHVHELRTGTLGH
jgi:molybdopterin-guanine dinucleotide biosynthesis protein